MAQWDRLTQLDAVYSQQLSELYDRDSFPIDVRHYLAHWVEKQDWQRAARDYDVAMVLFQGLLENLDIQHSRFVQEKIFLMQHNVRRYKQNFQRYQDDPCALASTIFWFLEKEKEILQSAELREQVQVMSIQQEVTGRATQQELERQMAGLRNDVQCMKHTMVCLEEQQDEFDFKYQTHSREVYADPKVMNEQLQALKLLVNKLDQCRKSTLLYLKKLLDRTESLTDLLVKTELVEWQRRQQKSCIGSPENVSLDQLEKWFTCVAECLFQMREFLSKLEELMGKVSYENDPVKAQKPALQKKADKLLRDLLKSSFVVENQPSMPQGKFQLILRTGVQFSVRTRLLVNFPELNNNMKVKVSMDREAPQTKGYRHFNVLGTSSKDLNMADKCNGGLVADFRHLTLKEQKNGGGTKGVSDVSLSVTEELHIMYFNTEFQLNGLSVELQASSLPVIIISNSSQQLSACASVLWFNMLSQDNKDVMFFVNAPSAPWPRFGEMLSWQFLAATKLGLNADQLEMIAQKLFGKQRNYDTLKVSWPKFSKESSPDTFWVWFDSILVMVSMYLQDLWRDGLIMGFVSKGREKVLLKRKQRGTFLFRFSERVNGGITFSWVDHDDNGQPEVKTIQPFTKNDLSQIPFQEIIRNFLIIEPYNVPENPLLYLYPNTPRDVAFGKYYTVESGGASPFIEYIKTKLLFVAKRNAGEAASPMSCDMSQDDSLQLINDLCEDAAGNLRPLEDVLEMSELMHDPMLPKMQSVCPLFSDELLEPQSNSILADSEVFQDVSMLPVLSLQEITSLSPQPCVNLF